MQIQNYFYFNGVPYEQLPSGKRGVIDRLIDRIKLHRLYERIFLYQDHSFNIIYDRAHRRGFESDLPDDLTRDIINAYMESKGADGNKQA